MKKKLLLTLLLALLALFFVACGGSSAPEPAADTDAADESASVTEDADTEEETAAETESDAAETAADDAAEEEEMEEETAAEEMEESEEADTEGDSAEEDSAEESADDEAAEEETAASGFGDLPLSGTDPDTGLEINPETVNPGDTYIVRGTIISMNLTPVTSPEFLVETPDGQKFRFRSQPLEDTYFIDGSQWEPFEYQLGVGAQATVSLAADASPSDIAISEDLTLIMLEE